MPAQEGTSAKPLHCALTVIAAVLGIAGQPIAGNNVVVWHYSQIRFLGHPSPQKRPPR